MERKKKEREQGKKVVLVRPPENHNIFLKLMFPISA